MLSIFRYLDGHLLRDNVNLFFLLSLKRQCMISERAFLVLHLHLGKQVNLFVLFSCSQNHSIGYTETHFSWC